MNDRPSAYAGFKLLPTLLIGLGMIILLIGLVPVSWLHHLLDPLSMDHHAAFLDRPSFSALRAGVAGTGLIVLLAGAFILAWPKRAGLVLGWLKKFGVDLWQDNRRLLADLLSARPAAWETALLAVITGAGFFARLVLLPGPMQYDESMSFIDYASHSLWTVLASYDAPNNHVFHTLLVHIAYSILGNAPWVVRLPAFTAGVLIIPGSYLLGRVLYNRQVGWLAAVLAAWWPQLVYYSANARGYSLLGLFSLLIFILAAVVIKKDRPAAWLWIAVFSALGLYTVPVMAFALGMLYLWLLFSFIAGETGPAYTARRFFLRILVCGISSLLLAGFFYLPIVVNSGLHALIGNEFVQSLSWQAFTHSLPYFLHDIWFRFTESMSWPFIVFLAAGLGLSIVLHRVNARHKVPILATSLLFFIVVIPLQRPQMLAKLFYFSLPLLAVWAASGWTAVIMLVSRRLPGRILSFTMVIIITGSCIVQALPNLPYLNGAVEAHEKAAAWFKTNLTQDDIALIDYPTDYRIYYYLIRLGIPLDSFRNQEKHAFKRAFVLVDPREGQTLQSVVADKSPSWCALDISSAQGIAEIDFMYIYTLNPLCSFTP